MASDWFRTWNLSRRPSASWSSLKTVLSEGCIWNLHSGVLYLRRDGRLWSSLGRKQRSSVPNWTMDSGGQKESLHPYFLEPTWKLLAKESKGVGAKRSNSGAKCSSSWAKCHPRSQSKKLLWKAVLRGDIVCSEKMAGHGHSGATATNTALQPSDLISL